MSTPPSSLPNHVAVIMDGNGRWAQERGLSRTDGHRAGAEAVDRILDCFLEMQIPWLTLYAFSSENWNRPRLEVAALMNFLCEFLKKKEPLMMEKGIRLLAIGHLDKLPKKCRKKLRETMEKTAGNSTLNLVLALSYGSRDEITDAVRSISSQVLSGEINVEDITPDLVSQNLYTAEIPDPDLLIRTSGEARLSNFLLWQLSYSELVITPKYWPDFTETDLHEAIGEYARRHRRFGRI